MKHLIIIAILAVIASSCLFEFPQPTDIELEASSTSLSAGEQATFTLTSSASGPRSIILEGLETSIRAPGTVTDLIFLERTDGRIVFGEEVRLSFVPDSESLGERVSLSEMDDTLTAIIGSQETLLSIDESYEGVTFTGIGMRTESLDLANATFTIESVETGELERVTVTREEASTMNLDEQRADITIVDFIMGSEGLESITILVEPEGLLASLYTQELEFTFESGKRIDLGASGTFDVFLEEAGYDRSETPVSATFSDSLTLERGASGMVGSTSVVFLGFEGDQARAVIGARVVRIPSSEGPIVVLSDTQTYGPGSYEREGESYRISYVVEGSDEVFGTFSYREQEADTIVTDTVSAEVLSSSEDEATIRFDTRGTYTIVGSVGDLSDQVTVRVS